MQEKQDIVKISVRYLVEFIFREGDIDNRRGMGDKDAMQMGSRIHRKIQRQMGSNYKAEQTLRIEVPVEEFSLVIEGRADGIIEEEDGIVIDEIKGVFKDVSFLKEPVMVHQAQAMCYGYIYAKERELDSISVQMTYCNMETEHIRRFKETFPFSYLEEWFTNLVNEYKKWVLYQQRWKRERQESIRSLQFPFPYRDGQKDLVTYVYRTIYKQKKLFIQAPTGVGKTISTIFPAVKAVGEGHAERIFYLTAKTITRTVASEAFSLLAEAGLRYKVLTITAKEKLCLCDEMECNPDHCPYAKGHYDRINYAVYQMLQEHITFSREVLLEGAQQYMVCPYELCLDLSLWLDAVICDYNYVFDPIVYLKRFFQEGVKGEYIFLIDEAHNLVERSREMYSAALYKEEFLELKRLFKDKNRKIANKLEKCNKYLLELKRECENYQEHNDIGIFGIYLLNLIGELEVYLEKEEFGEERKRVLDFYFELRAFMGIYERVDDNYVIYTELEEEGKFKLRLFCIDTGKNLQERLDKGLSTVYFSATLLPLHYYMRLLSDEKDDFAVYCESPFDAQQRLLMIGCDVSSKYTRRGPQEYRKIAAYIQKAVEARTGNYMVFFPSYYLMQSVLEYYEENQPEHTKCVVQTTNMNEQSREAFLEAFREEGDGSLVGFCVLGGIFGEGIDLKEDTLIGALIVGTGLPQVCNEREILKTYYDRLGMDGFAYAYRYPGMNKVLQSAGRVIRTTKDRGVILLLDDRFQDYQYKQLFPKEWEQHGYCRLDSLSSQLADFWNRLQ